MALTFFVSSLIGIIPIILWLIFFLWQDIKKPEPFHWIFIFFFLGMLITPIVWFLENGLIKLFGVNIGDSLPFVLLLIIYGGAALIEELAKFLTVFLFIRGNRYFDEAIDAMIYMIVLALGFGMVENILIAHSEISKGAFLLPVLMIMSLRFVGANLIHALSSGVIGFFWALKLVHKKNSYLYWGLLLGVVLHGLFNIAIIKFGSDAVFVMSLILFVVTAFLLWAFDALKKIKIKLRLIK